ncbi:MAG: hypothetical protein Q7R93_04580 [bacterium]|nr:hypothetical protein [bacterium]
MALDTTKLEAAVRAGDEAAIRAEFSTVLNRPYTEEEKTEALFVIGMLYTKLTNAVNQDYLEKLLAIKEAITAIDGSKRKLSEAVKLAQTRASLQ